MGVKMIINALQKINTHKKTTDARTIKLINVKSYYKLFYPKKSERKVPKNWNPILYVYFNNTPIDLYMIAGTEAIVLKVPEFSPWPDCVGIEKGIKIFSKYIEMADWFARINKQKVTKDTLKIHQYHKNDYILTKEKYEDGDIFTKFNLAERTYEKMYYVKDSKEFLETIDKYNILLEEAWEHLVQASEEYFKLGNDYDSAVEKLLLPTPINAFIDEHIIAIVNHFKFTEKIPQTEAEILQFRLGR
jgi:hypothetical protein